ncbi:MAG TPA: histidine phosphatase family protein [Chloroflexi bacterium]|nr:histidine phosphatase family protein [Chloroflexota bacterium]
MQLYFIRHGQSENNLTFFLTRSDDYRCEDPLLTAGGHEQAERLAEFLASRRAEQAANPRDDLNVTGFGLTHLYCSLMERAVATGAAVAKRLQLPLLPWYELHETGGVFLTDPATGERMGRPGRTARYLRHTYPELVIDENLYPDGWWNRSFEERPERRPRAERLLAGLLERHGGTDDRVAFFSHGHFYNHILGAILGLPEEPPAWFIINNTAITRIDYIDGHWDLVYANRTDHLPPHLIT